eukprot:TRINITY_DN943_c0_g1_i1.p1 TRINITY_DN943_c0_g1~~TRINITY_DN943_c0_g1_i1.p1  ORF type:complete len:209 (+),score=26.33 TRINITY_DN943_c0_g1_i1:91-627(+)
MDVQLIKMDAQGHEWSILEPLLALSTRVLRIIVELQDLPMDHWAKMYPNAPNTTLFQSQLASHGFSLQCCIGNHALIWVVDCYFTHQRAQQSSFLWPAPHMGKYWDAQRHGVYDKTTNKLVHDIPMDDNPQVSYPVCGRDVQLEWFQGKASSTGKWHRKMVAIKNGKLEKKQSKMNEA